MIRALPAAAVTAALALSAAPAHAKPDLFGKVGVNGDGFCSNTLTPPGSFQSWDLTGSELFEFDDGLAPIAK